MSKVFIIVDSGHNYSGAAEFGQLVFLNTPYRVLQEPTLLFAFLREALAEATENDSLLLGGPASACSIASALLTEWFGQLNLIIYRNGVYEQHKLTTTNN